MGRQQTILVNLKRLDLNQPWGISLVGGSDVGTPLIITRVGIGTPAEGQLYRGDIISKIGEYDSRDIRHEDAENLFRNAGNTIRFVIQRDTTAPRQPAVSTSLSSSRCSSALPPLSPLSLSPNPLSLNNALGSLGSPTTPYRSPSPAHSYKETLQQPLGNLPHTIFPSMDQNEIYLQTISPNQPAQNTMDEKAIEIEAVLNQPYRTTPLVLPGAKVKHEPAPTESYLRHHPNPSMRQGHYLDHETIMKQKVADSVLHKVVGGDGTVGGKQVVHKQFNSPINLYSEPNIANTIRQQTGVTPIKKNAVFDPSRSETLKALQEENYIYEPVQAVSNPVVPKVFTPQHHSNRVIPAKKPVPPPQVNNTNPYANSIGGDFDSIQQSGSFKRLMHNVLGQTDY
ncbi:PDZ and LIM domain protein 7 [Chrysoperla carnea]|uniref:PDZ and LIM domain protein 7 n=1 Tax=Chrysoperla carnea TaxID=189513 RepID=UPI001D085980|nr:PDZ and LIM domain protein 7 [Chrysoperla carnea]